MAIANTPVLQPGDYVRAGREASIQFADDRQVNLRIIRVHTEITTVGWIWLDAYVIDLHGRAVDRRTVFVQPAGLVRLSIGRRADKRDERVVRRSSATRRAPANEGRLVEVGA